MKLLGNAKNNTETKTEQEALAKCRQGASHADCEGENIKDIGYSLILKQIQWDKTNHLFVRVASLKANRKCTHGKSRCSRESAVKAKLISRNTLSSGIEEVDSNHVHLQKTLRERSGVSTAART